MNTTTYTVYNQTSGDVYGRGLSVTEAAEIILGHDGHEYEIRREGDAYQLFISRGSVNAYGGSGGMTEAYAHGRLIRSYAANETTAALCEAWAAIARTVIYAEWNDVPAVETDADYDEMLADMDQ